MNRFKFTARHIDLNGNERSQTTCEFEEPAWGEVADQFYQFLLGCGFILSRQDLSNHFFELDQEDTREGKEL